MAVKNELEAVKAKINAEHDNYINSLKNEIKIIEDSVAHYKNGIKRAVMRYFPFNALSQQPESLLMWLVTSPAGKTLVMAVATTTALVVTVSVTRAFF